MSYAERKMDQEVHEALNRERRNKLLNLSDPEIRRLGTEIRENILPAVKSDIDVDKLTETLLLSALLYASRDRLSGLSNKQRLRVETEAAMTVAKKLNIPLAVLYMDGKAFKEINDTFDHHVGDQVIKAIGIGIRESTRSTDITISQVEDTAIPNNDPNVEVARDGGDEFAAVLLGADLTGAEVVAKRMGLNIAEAVNIHVPQLQQTLGHPFEMTIGMALYDPNIHHTAEDLIKAADNNLSQIRHQMGEVRRS